jgi:hypothetical protein
VYEIPDYLKSYILENADIANKLINSKDVQLALQNYKQTEPSIIERGQKTSLLINDSLFFETRKIAESILKSDSIKTITRAYPGIEFKIVSNNEEIKNESDSITIQDAQIKDVALVSNIIDQITLKECANFLNYLSNYPMLGYKETIGKRIFNYIEKQERKNINGVTGYRIRISTDRKQIAYTENEMFEPTYGLPKQNRFSMIGINPLYISTSLEVAALETSIDEKTKYTWIELQVKSDLNVLDITNTNIPLFDQCHKQTEKNNMNLHLEYLLANYIADCAKNCGFDGIKYISVYQKNAVNYVLFNTAKRDFVIKNIDGVIAGDKMP